SWGAPTWVQGRYGTGLLFNGVNDTLDYAPASDFTGLSNKTLSAWVLPTGSGSLGETIFTTMAKGKNAPAGYWFGLGPGNYTPAFTMADGTRNETAWASRGLAPNEWHHVAASYNNATRGASFWIDGAPAGTSTLSLVTLGVITASFARSGGEATNPDPVGGHQAGFHGTLDELHVYRRPITDSEALALYLGASAGIGLQYNLLSQAVSNANLSGTTQLNLLQSQVMNLNGNLSSQTNTVLVNLSNLNTSLQSQVNLLQAHVANVETNVSAQVNLVSANLSTLNATVGSQYNGLVGQVVNTNLNLSAQTNYVTSLLNQTNASVGTQLNSVQVSLAQGNANITAQVSYVGLVVNNTNASLGSQLSTVTSQVQNTNASVASQANAIMGQIVNQNTNVSNQYNSLSLLVRNEEANITSQV